MASKRRGKGEGSIYRRKDGRWVGQYEVNGKRKYVSGKTRAEVSKKLTKAIAERDAGLAFDAEGLTVGEYLTRWLATVRGTVKDNTWSGHEINVRVHLSPALGYTKLDKLNPFQVQSFYRAKLDNSQSPASVLKIHGTLSKALKAAVRWRLIPLNPCADVTPPRLPKANVRALEVQQVKTLLNAAEDTDLYALWVLLSTTAVRIGEALALQWDDLNLDARTLRVHCTLTRDGIGSVKTSTSRRMVKLPKMTVDALRKHHRNGSGFVFSTGKGTSINVCNLRNRVWKPLLAKAGLPTDTHIHALRHSAITLLLSKGVPVKVVSEMAGHADVSITIAVYQSVLPHMQDGAADCMDDALR
jgi:integrase